MKTIRITEILEYYDGIQIFAARDSIGGHYLGDMIDTVGDHDRYAVVGVRPERLSDFRIGLVDLLTLMLETPGGVWYISMAEGDITGPPALIPQSTPLAESGYLPKDGYFLRPEEPPDDKGVRRTLESAKAVTLAGSVEQVNRSTGEWALLTSDGLQSGKTTPGGPSLDGLQVGKHYRFKCPEVTEQDLLWRDQKSLFLQNIEST